MNIYIYFIVIKLLTPPCYDLCFVWSQTISTCWSSKPTVRIREYPHWISCPPIKMLLAESCSDLRILWISWRIFRGFRVNKNYIKNGQMCLRYHLMSETYGIWLFSWICHIFYRQHMHYLLVFFHSIFFIFPPLFYVKIGKCLLYDWFQCHICQACMSSMKSGIWVMYVISNERSPGHKSQLAYVRSSLVE